MFNFWICKRCVLLEEVDKTRQLSTDMDNIDFASNFRGDQNNLLCLCISIAFNPVSMTAVCCPDRTDEAATTFPSNQTD